MAYKWVAPKKRTNDVTGRKIVRNGFVIGVIAEVISSDNFGTEESPNWLIEYYDEDGHYHYWKQKNDGGELA